jgi:hypothetical protein
LHNQHGHLSPATENIQVRGLGPIGILECWNNGIMGPGKMGYGVNGKFVLTIQLKWILFFLKTSIPQFQFSTIEAKTQTS